MLKYKNFILTREIYYTNKKVLSLSKFFKLKNTAKLSLQYPNVVIPLNTVFILSLNFILIIHQPKNVYIQKHERNFSKTSGHPVSTIKRYIMYFLRCMELKLELNI